VPGPLTKDHLVPPRSAPPFGALTTLHQPARAVPVAAGEYLAHAGHPTTSHFVVVTGTVEARRAGRVVASSGPGEVAGGLQEVAAPRPTDLVARTDVVVLELSVGQLRDARPAVARGVEAA
jgi:CRP-like cAMP-binding protein